MKASASTDLEDATKTDPHIFFLYFSAIFFITSR